MRWRTTFLALLFVSLASEAEASSIENGRYLATLGDCVVCHTAPEGGAKLFAGGYPLHATFGTIYSTNITPDRQTGIGNWNANQFYRAMHHGIAADGHHLYPAFPYPYFDKISRSDSGAIFAYLRSLSPIHQPPRKNKLIFPTNIRWLMTFWNWLFVPQSQFRHDPSKSIAWNRGGEIVHGLAHCGGCHTPKNFFFSDEAGKALYGATIDGWHAPNLTSSGRTGLGRWTVSDIEQFLKTGKNRFGWVVGSMRDVVKDSSSKWTDVDRHAVALYLKSLSAAPESEPKKPDADSMQDGQAVFVARCSVCHSARNKEYPSLVTNSVIGEAEPTTLLRVILKGSQSAAVAAQPRDFSMPGFAVLTNTQLAHLATYLRNSWGNRADRVSVSTARQTRNTLKSRD
jgi:mono/diheme cytochrome c family protein